MSKSPVFPVVNTSNYSDSRQMNPGWCVAIVRFKEPAAMYDNEQLDVGLQSKNLLVIENDCVSVSINRPKASFGKTANLTLKNGEIYYQNAVAPGDWVFIWMSDWDDDTSRIAEQLRDYGMNPSKGLPKPLNGWSSGLKFVGRVQTVSSSDSVSPNGVRTMVTNVQCQAHLEFATSVYYTFVAKQGYDPNTGSKDATGQASGATSERDAGLLFWGSILKSQTNLSGKYLDSLKALIKNSLASPDSIISTLFTVLFGIERDENILAKVGSLEGTFSDAIGIPGEVGAILGRDGANKLYEIYNVYAGIQRYEVQAKKVWENFCPILSKDNDPNSIFLASPTRCRGRLPFRYAPRWDNVGIWSIFQELQDPIVNEMYACLRINNKNQIVPSLVIREMPYGTNLFDNMNKIMRQIKRIPEGEPTPYEPPKTTQDIPQEEGNGLFSVAKPHDYSKDVCLPEEKASEEKPEDAKTSGASYEKLLVESSDSSPLEESSRTMFRNLPRWLVGEEFITSINTSSSEANRINFVQVTSRQGALDTGGATDPEALKLLGFATGNFVVDSADIKRNGLRADISETVFDVNVIKNSVGLGPLYAKLRADWLFNGHLKTSGTINCTGIKAPICEGDNLEVRGVVYHISGLSFNGAIASNGKKTFTTSISVTNGMLAQGLEDTLTQGKKELPMYPVHLNPERRNQAIWQNVQGVTDVERFNIATRNVDGELQPSPNKDKRKKGKK